MSDPIVKAAWLRPFLHDVARGYLTRRGYRTFTLAWNCRAVTLERKAQVGQAIAAGLVTWNGITGPHVAATLTDAGREALK